MSESAGKALDILFYLAKASSEISLARMSKETGMNKATALRYLSVLESRGVVERHHGGWTLGLSLFELGSKVPVRALVVEKLKPIIERLARESGESVNLACLAGDSAIYLDRAEANRSLRMRSAPGDRLPLYCTGVGKAILSQLSEERIRAILGSVPLPKINETTLTEPEDVIREAKRARELGYGVDREEYEIGLTCIAMPLHLPGSDFAGAISISGPSARMRNPEAKERFLDLLRVATQEALQAILPYEGDQNTTALSASSSISS
jgi:IclR family acetate operon transcriptional repressor